MKWVSGVFCTVFCLIGIVQPCLAIPVFDQGFESLQPPWTGAGIYSNQEIAQSFVSGIEGTLSRVDVNVFKTGIPGPILYVDIRRMDGSVPSMLLEDILFAASYGPDDIIGTSIYDPAFLSVDTSSANISVSNGDELAIVLTSPTSAYDNWYNWAGVYYQDPYPPGVGFIRLPEDSPNGGFYSLGAGVPIDFSFRTFVEPVPEPATILILGSGIIGLVGFRRKLRKE